MTDMQLCIHGIYTKLQCEKCHDEHLQNQISSLSSMYKDLTIKWVALHEHHVRQIDENRKISKRMDELQDTKYESSVFVKCYREICEKIARLEQSREAGSRTHKDFSERLQKLESDQKKYFDYIDTIRQRKMPHRCPVCSGSCYWTHESKDNTVGVACLCRSCEGKGIVWG